MMFDPNKLKMESPEARQVLPTFFLHFALALVFYGLLLAISGTTLVPGLFSIFFAGQLVAHVMDGLYGQHNWTWSTVNGLSLSISQVLAIALIF
jgi:hypothetical protein